jgi:hypothetical protein
MESKLKKIIAFAEPSIAVGLSVFFIIFLITFLLQMNGLSLLEVFILPFISGIILFFGLFIANFIVIKRIKADINFSLTENKFIHVLLIFFFTLIIYILLDSILYLIDDSLSKEYASAIYKFSDPGDIETQEGLENLPFSIQNLIVTIFFGLFSMICTLPFINTKTKNI